MGINRESDVAANLQIGPTSLGMVRLYIETDPAGCRSTSSRTRPRRSPRSCAPLRRAPKAVRPR